MHVQDKLRRFDPGGLMRSNAGMMKTGKPASVVNDTPPEAAP